VSEEGGKGRRGERERKGKGKAREGRGVAKPLKYFGVEPPLVSVCLLMLVWLPGRPILYGPVFIVARDA